MEFFDREAIVAVDGGNMGLWAVNGVRVYRPRSFLWSTDMGMLGTGLPFALGAKLAYWRWPSWAATSPAATPERGCASFPGVKGSGRGGTGRDKAERSPFVPGAAGKKTVRSPLPGQSIMMPPSRMRVWPVM
ncbi:MAG: hypothetical protein H5T72_00590 [Actinobacteria bacterium]|nr:hypothetical protein [Actinomycetota bacterium]